MSDTTVQDCICCGIESDCINGLCENCSDFDYKQRKPKTLHLHSMDGAIQTVTVPELESEEHKLQKQSDLLTLGLLEEKNKNTKLMARVSKLERALALTKNMLCCGESFTKESRHIVEQALEEPKLCICCEEITEENAHLHRNCGK